jgi:hypothetical protein
MPYRVEILLFGHGNDDNPERFTFVENDHLAIHLPNVGDLVVIDGQHIGKVTLRTFFYEPAAKRGLFLVSINARREAIRPPTAPAH